MFRSTPIAYLLTWTCYGTWLHGDDRGSVDHANRAFGTPFMPTDLKRQRLDGDKLKQVQATLDATARETVTATIRRHANVRGWMLHAINVRTNHVHVIVSCGDTRAERALAELKAWTTRQLRENGSVAEGALVWTHHGSTRYLWNEQCLSRAIEYVSEHQGADLV